MHGVDRVAVDDLRLGGAWIGDDNAAHTGRAGEHRGREDATDRAHGAIEVELAENEQVGERVGRDGALGDQDREGMGRSRLQPGLRSSAGEFAVALEHLPESVAASGAWAI